MRQTARPRDCALCSIMTGKHAMHPLYNTGGTDGCHRVLAAQPARGLVKRTAWVHTACAVAISTSRKLGGCVYGCFEDGTYEEDSGYADDDEEHEFDCDETTVAATAVATVAPSNIQHKNKEDPDSTVDTTGTGSTAVMKKRDSTTSNSSNTTTNMTLAEAIQAAEASAAIKVEEGIAATTKQELETKDETEEDGNNTCCSSESSCIFGEERNGETTETKSEELVPIGTKVSKQFNDGIVYHGTILTYDTTDHYYQIRYEDGDEEEMEEAEVRDCIDGKIGGAANNTPVYEALHHYVISEGKTQVRWIHDMRQTKCMFCGNAPTVCPVETHIPMQCTAGEEGEDKAFQKYHDHSEELGDHACLQAMHIGCALWDPKPFFPPRLYINTGFTTNSEPTVELYCNLHAKQILDGHQQKRCSIATTTPLEAAWVPPSNRHPDEDDDDDLEDADLYDPVEIPHRRESWKNGTAGVRRRGSSQAASSSKRKHSSSSGSTLAARSGTKKKQRSGSMKTHSSTKPTSHAVAAASKRRASSHVIGTAQKRGSSIIAAGGGAKRKHSVKGGPTLSTLLERPAAAGTTAATASLNRDNKKQLKVARIEGKVYEKASSRNNRTRQALVNSDNRDCAVALGEEAKDDDDEEHKDQDRNAAKRQAILKRGLESIETTSRVGASGDLLQTQQRKKQKQQRSSMFVSVEAGGKKKEPPQLLDVTEEDLFGIDEEMHDINENSDADAAKQHEGKDPEEEEHHPQPVQSLTTMQRRALVDEMKSKFVFEVFKRRANGKSDKENDKLFDGPVVKVQKKAWMKRLVPGDTNETHEQNDNLNVVGDGRTFQKYMVQVHDHICNKENGSEMNIHEIMNISSIERPLGSVGERMKVSEMDKLFERHGKSYFAIRYNKEDGNGNWMTPIHTAISCDSIRLTEEDFKLIWRSVKASLKDDEILTAATNGLNAGFRL